MPPKPPSLRPLHTHTTALTHTTSLPPSLPLLLFSVVSGVRSAAAKGTADERERPQHWGGKEGTEGEASDSSLDFVLAFPFLRARARVARLCQPSSGPMGALNSPSGPSHWPIAAEDAVDVALVASRRTAETRCRNRRIDERGGEGERISPLLSLVSY